MTFDEWEATHDPANWEVVRDMIRAKELSSEQEAELLMDRRFSRWLELQASARETWRRSVGRLSRRLSDPRVPIDRRTR